MAAALAGLSRGLKIFLVVDLVLVVVLGVAAILVLGGDSDDRADTPQAPATSSAPAASDGATDADSGDAATSETEQRFASPTGNIACGLSADGATCTIANTSVEPPQIDGCTGAGTGHVITLTADGVDVPCTDEEPAAAGADVDVLQYGSSQTVGDYTCTSASNGMTCVNGEGAGFRIATAERVELP